MVFQYDEDGDKASYEEVQKLFQKAGVDIKNEALEYQQGKINARKVKMTIKPLGIFNTEDIRQIRRRTGLSQVMFAGSLGVSAMD